MILLIDNYDSFVYNLARYLVELGCAVQVTRNDALTLQAVEHLSPRAVVLSPGPKAPAQAGLCVSLIRRFGARLPILGVCLGHQCIGQAYGGRVGRARVPMHGKAAPVIHDGRGVFRGLPTPMPAGRYHSLVVQPDGLPADLEISARSPEGEIMALRHRRHPVVGVQFHPESVLTPQGYDLLRNFLEMTM